MILEDVSSLAKATWYQFIRFKFDSDILLEAMRLEDTYLEDTFEHFYEIQNLIRNFITFVRPRSHSGINHHSL
jgi:hypothetical protein